MQFSYLRLQREVQQRLESILAGILDEDDLQIQHESSASDEGVDFVVSDSRGRRWLIETKTSSGPGQIAAAAEQLRRIKRHVDGIEILVVPYMSAAGARTADRFGVNWVDLAGNAQIREVDDHLLRVWIQGKPNPFRERGRPSSPFAPRSARITRQLLNDPLRWWTQADLARATGLNDGTVSRLVRALDQHRLLERRDKQLRPLDPDLLLDAWVDDYRFEAHEILTGHLTGAGIDGARKLSSQLEARDVHHAFTGLAAAWAIDHFARFRLATVFVDADPTGLASDIGVRREEAGANLQIVRPNDVGIFAGERTFDALPCVAPVQAYLDLQHLPERSAEAAQRLRETSLGWNSNVGI